MAQQLNPSLDGKPEDQQLQNHPLSAIATPLQQQVDLNGAAIARQDAFGSPSIASRTASMTLSPLGASQAQSSACTGDTDGDFPMEDADPFNKQKYAARSTQRSRPTSQYLPQEESAAARRYSPMNLSPTSPYVGHGQPPAQGPYTSYTPHGASSRSSPTRPGLQSSHSQPYYSSPSKSPTTSAAI